MRLHTVIAATAILLSAGCLDQPLVGEALAIGPNQRTVTEEDFDCDSCAFDVGDVNETGNVDMWDWVDLIDYLYGGGPIENLSNADVNGDDTADLSDVIYLQDYVHNGGPAPVDRHCYSNCDAFCAEEIAGVPVEELLEATEQCLSQCEFILPIIGAPEECRLELN